MHMHNFSHNVDTTIASGQIVTQCLAAAQACQASGIFNLVGQLSTVSPSNPKLQTFDSPTAAMQICWDGMSTNTIRFL